MDDEKEFPVHKTEAQWRAELGDEEYRVLREGHTEAPFSGELDQAFEPGMYQCGACGNQIFTSDRKYDAGCGWPSFDEAIPGSVVLADYTDPFLGTETSCARCGSHLGHLFPDGPEETTGQRYCINSIALKFDPTGALEEYRRRQEEKAQ